MKPHVLRDPASRFDPYDFKSWSKTVSPVTVTVTVMSARHLVKRVKDRLTNK